MRNISTGTGLAILGVSAIACVVLHDARIGTPAQASTPSAAAIASAALGQASPTIVWYDTESCLVSWASQSYTGITLTRASYAVYYSLGFSYENFKQSRDRIHRAGQTKPCTYYILLAEDTVDEAAYGVVRGKGKASDALLAVLSGNMKDLSE